MAGFGVGYVQTTGAGASPVFAALMTGAAAGLFAHVLKAPAWGSLVAGTGAALVAKFGIDRLAEGTA